MRVRLVLTLFLSVFFSLSTAQTDNQPEDYKIRLIKLKNGKTKMLNEGRKIRFRLNDFEGTYKGRISDITPDSIRIDEVWITTNRIRSIRIKLRGTTIAGAGLTSLGVITGGLGTALLLSTLQQGGGAAIVGIIIGVPVAGAGALAIISGVPMIFIGKKYDLEKKWTMDIVQDQ